MKIQAPGTLPSLGHEEEAAIKAITETMSEQIHQAVAASLTELFMLIREKRDETAHEPDEFLTAVDVAGILKISKARAYQMIKTRVISSFAFGRTVRVRRSDLDTFIQDHLVR
jgi:excisionase family DNA binding protein